MKIDKSNDRTEKRRHKNRFAESGVQCSADTFVVKSPPITNLQNVSGKLKKHNGRQ